MARNPELSTVHTIVCKENKTTQILDAIVWLGGCEGRCLLEGAIAQGVHCEAGPVDTAVGIYLASGCLVFVYSGIAFC